MHEIYIERAAERDLKGLPTGAFARVIARIRALAANPRPEGSRRISGSDRDRRIRIGDYRLADEVDDEASVVRVMRVRHRSDVYR